MSTEYIAVLVSLLSVILPKIGIPIAPEELSGVVTSVVTTISAIYLLIKRYKRGGLTPLGFRKAN